MQPSQIVLLAAVGFFGVYLFFKFRPGAWGSRKGLARSVRDARSRAHTAKTPEERSAALCDAGTAASDGRRWVAAAGYFLRAMKSAPRSAELVRRTAAGLVGRPRLAERMFWRRMAALSVDAEHREARVETLRALAKLYEGPLRDVGRARVLRRTIELEGGGTEEVGVSAKPGVGDEG